MKYIILSILAVMVMFGISFVVTGVISKRLKKKLPRFLQFLISLLGCLLLSFVAGFVYLSIHYSVQEEALEVLSDPAGAIITRIDGGYFVDGSGETVALIFYPGAKVDTEAYLPLMKQIADNGVDCFLADMPMRMAIFDKNAADKFITNYNYDCWMIGGHSMGGMVAAKYAKEHPDMIDGVVLLAAYPTEKLSDSTGLLSVYGTEDKILDRKQYDDAKKFFPSHYTQIAIVGGNHSQFGNYGFQSGDGVANITTREQQTQTAFAIVSFSKEIG